MSILCYGRYLSNQPRRALRDRICERGNAPQNRLVPREVQAVASQAMKMKLLTLSSFGALAVLFCFVGLVRAADQPKDKTPWKITGQLEEACSCDAACPCWFDSKPTKMTCGGGQVLFIRKGNYGKAELDGLASANMGQSPEGQAMMSSFGNWNFS